MISIKSILRPTHRRAHTTAPSKPLLCLILACWIVGLATPSVAGTITLTRPPAKGYTWGSKMYPNADAVAAKVCVTLPRFHVHQALAAVVRRSNFVGDW